MEWMPGQSDLLFFFLVLGSIVVGGCCEIFSFNSTEFDFFFSCRNHLSESLLWEGSICFSNVQIYLFFSFRWISRIWRRIVPQQVTHLFPTYRWTNHQHRFSSVIGPEMLCGWLHNLISIISSWIQCISRVGWCLGHIHVQITDEHVDVIFHYFHL